MDVAARTADFEAGIDRVTKQLDQLGETVKSAFEFAGVTVGLDALVSKFDDFVNSAAQLEQTSKSIGIAVDDLSRLQFAATQVGLSSDQLTTSAERFAKTAEQAAAGGRTQAAAFEAIGVSVKDASGNLKPMSDLLDEVANRFAGYADGATKTALAQTLFGRSGSDLIPLLDKGAAGIQELEQRSDELGNTINDKTAKAADAFNSKLGELTAVANGFWNLAAQALLPTLTHIADAFVSAGDGAEKFGRQIAALETAVNVITSAVYVSYRRFVDLGDALGNVAATAAAVAKGHFSEAKDIWNDGTQHIEQTASDEFTFLQGLWSGEIDKSQAWRDGLVSDWNLVANAAKTQAPVVVTAIDDTANAYDRLTAEVEKSLIAQGVAIDNKVEAQLQSLPNKAVHYGTTMWDQMDQISQSGAAAIQNDFANFLVNPAQVGFKGLVISFAQTLDQMLAKAVATDLFGSLFGTDKEGNSGLGGILGGVLGSLFSSSASSARTDWAGADAGIVGHALGADFTVGGSGGMDSQLVQFMASPGERVRVTPQGKSGGDPISIVVNATVGDIASRSDVVAGMQQALNGAVAKIQDMNRRGSFKAAR